MSLARLSTLDRHQHLSFTTFRACSLHSPLSSIKIRTQQHLEFHSSLSSKYYPCSKFLNSGVQLGTDISNMTRPLAHSTILIVRLKEGQLVAQSHFFNFVLTLDLIKQQASLTSYGSTVPFVSSSLGRGF